jgi:methylthioribulose-1-phosphate dehydratase
MAGVPAVLILQVASPGEDFLGNIPAVLNTPSLKCGWQEEDDIIQAMIGARKRTGNNSSRHSKRDKADARFDDLAKALAEVGRSFYQRGWVFGTSGNFSAVVSNQPLRLAITPTGLDKGALDPAQFLEIDETSRVVRGNGRPSAETGLHLAIVRAREAGAVLHTHSLWSTVHSDAFSSDGAVTLEGFEMLKGLRGVHTHEHREILPIVENSQEIARMAEQVRVMLKSDPDIHGFLIRRHGLYTWGQDLAEAKRHVEVLEFLLEVFGRSRCTIY